MSRITNTKVAYGKSQGLIDIFNAPIVSLRDPGANDKGSIGQLWTNKTLNTVWMLTSFLAGAAVWTELDNAGAIAGIVWTIEAGAAVNMANYHGYITANAGVTTSTLPVVSAVGSVIEIVGGAGTTNWIIAQRAGQYIRFNNQTTTVGVVGQVLSTHFYDTVKLITRVADVGFEIVRSNDNLLIA
jgi:hypothetical protein